MVSYLAQVYIKYILRECQKIEGTVSFTAG